MKVFWHEPLPCSLHLRWTTVTVCRTRSVSAADVGLDRSSKSFLLPSASSEENAVAAAVAVAGTAEVLRRLSRMRSYLGLMRSDPQKTRRKFDDNRAVLLSCQTCWRYERLRHVNGTSYPHLTASSLIKLLCLLPWQRGAAAASCKLPDGARWAKRITRLPSKTPPVYAVTYVHHLLVCGGDCRSIMFAFSASYLLSSLQHRGVVLYAGIIIRSTHSQQRFSWENISMTHQSYCNKFHLFQK